MKFVAEIPADEASRLKKRKSLTRTRKALSHLCFICAAIAIVFLIAALIMLLTLELKEDSTEHAKRIFTILVGAFAGGAVLFAGGAFGFGALLQRAHDRELDFAERCDSEHSFYVGDGFLATFEESNLRIHSEKGGKTIRIPYAEMRFFSVCERKLPKEKGAWRVVLELPSHYLTEKKPDKEDKPALVQTDAKPRLYDCLKAHDLVLAGELPKEVQNKSKFKRVAKYARPDGKSHTVSYAMIAIGAVAVVASVPVAIFINLTVGMIIGVLGLFFAGRSLYTVLNAKSELVLYKEGIWWRERIKQDSIFLKWEEIEHVSAETVEGKQFLLIECVYGVCHLPYAEGALERILDMKSGAAE